MSARIPHAAFSVIYNQRQAALVTDCAVRNPYGKGFKHVKALWDTGATGSVVSPQLALL